MDREKITTAVIFAGGKSSRMGRDKALLPIGSYGSMAEFQYRKLESIFSKVYISSKCNKFDFKPSIILDRYEISSPMVALASVLQEIECDAVLILSVDMPLISLIEIERMVSYYQECDMLPDIVLAKSPRGKEPLFGIYTKKVLPKIMELINMKIHKLGAIFEDSNVKYVSYDNLDIFLNINTPEDYASISL